MPDRFDIEFLPPQSGDRCRCCGGVTTYLKRLVKRDGAPHAMILITFTEGHPEAPAAGIFGIGMFGEGTTPRDRVAFSLGIAPSGVALIDATDDRWPDTGILGRKLTRDEALQHPRKAELFDVVDRLYAQDVRLTEHLRRAAGTAPDG